MQWLRRLLRLDDQQADGALAEAASQLEAVSCRDPEINEVVAELRYQRLEINHVGERIRAAVGGAE